MRRREATAWVLMLALGVLLLTGAGSDYATKKDVAALKADIEYAVSDCATGHDVRMACSDCSYCTECN